MTTWLNETLRLLTHFFGRGTPAETYIVIALCVLLGALALNRVSLGLGAIGAFYTTALLLTPLGLVLLIAALALPSVWGLNAGWMPVVTAALVFLVVVVSFTALFQKGDYVTMLIAWTVTLLVVWVVLTLEPPIKQSFDDFKIRLENGRLFDSRRTETELWK